MRGNLYKIFGGVYRLPCNMSKARIKELVNKGHEAELSGQKSLLEQMKDAGIIWFMTSTGSYQLMDGEYVLVPEPER